MSTNTTMTPRANAIVTYTLALSGDICPFCRDAHNIAWGGSDNYLCLHCEEQWDTSRIHDLVANLA
jgi:hypothetical protein